MKFALVKHKLQSPKTFWFTVPEELEKYTIPGAFVFCENYKGFAPGKVVQTYEDDDMELFCEEWDMDAEKMKPIFEVSAKVPRAKVIVPRAFKKTPPKKEKLEEKLQYYNKHGHFESRIIVGDDLMLLDGFTSFVIADAKDMTMIPVMIASKAAVSKKLFV